MSHLLVLYPTPKGEWSSIWQSKGCIYTFSSIIFIVSVFRDILNSLCIFLHVAVLSSLSSYHRPSSFLNLSHLILKSIINFLRYVLILSWITTRNLCHWVILVHRWLVSIGIFLSIIFCWQFLFSIRGATFLRSWFVRFFHFIFS